MDRLEEPEEVLVEDDIISTEEKEKIISRIDKDFKSYFKSSLNETDFTIRSKGFTAPLLFGVISLLMALAIVFLFNRFDMQQSSSTVLLPHEVSESEWGVLKVYMRKTERELTIKNTQIKSYKVKIVNYDRRLSTLRELLRIKNEIEKQLETTKGNLEAQGKSTEEITSSLEELRTSMLSKLNPDLVSSYSMSMSEINNQINKVLNEKSEAEAEMKNILAEQENLKAQNRKLQEQAQQKENENNALTQSLKEMNTLRADAAQYKNDRAVYVSLDRIYTELFKNLQKEEYPEALTALTAVRKVLHDTPSFTNKATELALVNTMQQYVQHTAEQKLQSRPEKPILDAKLSTINSSSSSRTPAEGNDTSKLLSKEHEESTSVLEKSGTIPSSAQILLGAVSRIDFDQIGIDLLSDTTVHTGSIFYLYEKKSDQKRQLIGSGVLTTVSKNSAIGVINTLESPSLRPKVADLVYVAINMR